MIKLFKHWKIIDIKSKSMYLFGILWIISLFIIWQEYNKSEDIKNNMSLEIEQNARYNARNIAIWIWECIKWQIKDYTNIKDIKNIIKFCGSAFRSWWPTWDFFVFDRISKTMFYDWSPDCMKLWNWRDFNPIKEKEFLLNNKKEWECYAHSDQKLCLSAISNLYNIGNTDINSKIYWKYDDSIEWLESYVIPSLWEWFNWNIWEWWVFNINNLQLQIVMWTQEDEVMLHFKNNIKVEKFINNITIILSFITFICWCMYFMLTLLIKESKNGHINNNSL